MRKIIKFITSKAFILTIILLLQLVSFFVLINVLSNDYVYVQISLQIFSVLIAFYIISTDVHPMYKISWIFPILLFPVFGGIFYLFYYIRNVPLKEQKRFNNLIIARKDVTFHHDAYQDDQTQFLKHFNWYPHKGTKTTFLPSGKDKLTHLLEDLTHAEKYIFLEFFIISKSQMFDRIYESLLEKLKQGVQVTILYDDFGSAFKLPHKQIKTLEKNGARIIAFNKMQIHLNFSLNYRNHRKIAVIDGKIGYTGGVNIGDEYTNNKRPFGMWHDAAIKIEGRAVWPLLLSTLSTIYFQTNELLNYQKYYIDYAVQDDGIVLPFDDVPNPEGRITKDLLTQMMMLAKHRIWLTTPYLILDNEMVNALKIAKKRGVDIKIIIPSIPDKRLVYMVSESYVAELVKADIEIYKFTPGFIHSKLSLFDEDTALIGTSNLDFRSLYLHFENNVYLKGATSVFEMQKYFNNTLLVSKLVTKDDLRKRNILYRLIQGLLKGFSPIL